MTAARPGLGDRPCLRDATSIVGLCELARRDHAWPARVRRAFQTKPPINARTSIDEVLRHDHIGRLCRGNAVGTLKRNRSVARHVAKRFGTMLPIDVTEPQQRRHELQYEIENEDRPNGQVRREICMFRLAVWWVQSEVLDQPLVARRRPTQTERVGRKPSRPLPALEGVALVLERGRDPLVASAIVLALAVGAPTRVLLKVRREHIDLRGATVLVDGVRRRLPPWAVEQLRETLTKRRGLVFRSKRRENRPTTTLARRVRRACHRAVETPFTLRDLRRLWQLEARAVGLPRATTRGTTGWLKPAAASRVVKRMRPAERKLAAAWAVMIHGPADAPGWRRYVPARSPKGRAPHLPEVRRRTRRQRMAGRYRVAASCRSDAPVPEPARSVLKARRGGGTTTRRRERPDEFEPALWAERQAPPPALAPPIVRVPVISERLRVWEDEQPEDYARKSDLMLAFGVSVMFNEARNLMKHPDVMKGAGPGLQRTLTDWADRAEALDRELKAKGFEEG